MKTQYEIIKEELKNEQHTFFVTGAAGFIGSNIAEELLTLNQKVIILDNLSTGYLHNIEDIKNKVGDKSKNLTFVKGDIRDLELCKNLLKNVFAVIHEAALGSVPRSLNNPQESESVNVGGFINVLQAMVECNIKRIVFASSSSVYGDNQDDYKKEENIGDCLSPYAVTKYSNELYAKLYKKLYDIEYVALRYFNVFGHRQDPKGAYAAVIPLWIDSIINGKECTINGDGTTSRDFCYIKNVVQANILGAMTKDPNSLNKVYNVAFGQKTSLTDLYKMIASTLSSLGVKNVELTPSYGPFRKGDIKHSLADISKAKKYLGYEPQYSIGDGLAEYLNNFC